MIFDERFDELIDYIDDLLSEAYDEGSRGHGLSLSTRLNETKIREILTRNSEEK
jgi:hypothetical protein